LLRALKVDFLTCMRYQLLPDKIAKPGYKTVTVSAKCLNYNLIVSTLKSNITEWDSLVFRFLS
jgi:hypothetical protein